MNYTARCESYSNLHKCGAKAQSFQAKKVKIPFMWLARLAVRIVKPAVVRSFNFTLFENLNFSSSTLDEEMQTAMRNSLSPDWSPILRIRSQNEDQVYAYMREDGKNLKLMLVTINRDEAAVIRATFNPEKLADFLDNPRIFGVSLGDNHAQVKGSDLKAKGTENIFTVLQN